MSLNDYWYIAARSRDVGKKPVRLRLFGRPMVLFRTESGAPGLLLDRCAHRNTALSTGRVRGDCLECPYHGWQYNTEGRCELVPSLGCDAKIPDLQVPSFPVVEQQGYLWFYPGELKNGSHPFCFPHWGEDGWTSFAMKTRFQGAVETCLENFLDCPHTVFVHKGWFRNPDARELQARVEKHAGGVRVTFQNEPISKSVVSRLLFPKGRELKHTDQFLMPNISRVDYDFGPDRHFIITSQCTPVTEEETEVYTMITFRFGRLGWLVRLFFEPLCRKIIAQDVDILKNHAAQLREFGGPRYSHVETDLLGLHIHALRSKAERAVEKVERSEKEITIRF